MPSQRLVTNHSAIPRRQRSGSLSFGATYRVHIPSPPRMPEHLKSDTCDFNPGLVHPFSCQLCSPTVSESQDLETATALWKCRLCGCGPGSGEEFTHHAPRRCCVLSGGGRWKCGLIRRWCPSERQISVVTPMLGSTLSRYHLAIVIILKFTE